MGNFLMNLGNLLMILGNFLCHHLLVADKAS